MPNLDEGENTTSYVVTTYDYKMVCDYTRLNFLQIQDLYCDEFMLLLRDAFIYKMKQSEKGIEYLDECKILEATTPDRKKLRNQFGKGE